MMRTDWNFASDDAVAEAPAAGRLRLPIRLAGALPTQSRSPASDGAVCRDAGRETAVRPEWRSGRHDRTSLAAKLLASRRPLGMCSSQAWQPPTDRATWRREYGRGAHA